MKKYCEECGREVDARVICKRESYIVSGESIEVEAEVLACPQCGEEFYCERLDHTTLLKAYNEYRRRHKLLQPEEIKEIREQYGLSQRSFAKILNWGDKTVHRYENGSLQDKAHNSLLLFLRSPENMKAYLAENEVPIGGRQKEKLLEKIGELEEVWPGGEGKKLLDKLFRKRPSIENGFREFDFEKFCAMVVFFAGKCDGLLKVKLLKLLNYSDMVFYKENGISISGTQYVHLPYGPVPKNYDILLGMMEAEGIVHIEVNFEQGYEKHQVMPGSGTKEEVLTREETEVLERVYRKFANFGSAEISDYSHRERGYRDTKKGEVISYAYAKDIRLD